MIIYRYIEIYRNISGFYQKLSTYRTDMSAAEFQPPFKPQPTPFTPAEPPAVDVVEMKFYADERKKFKKKTFDENKELIANFLRNP